MPSSPIIRKVKLPANWIQLQKMLTPDQATGCYWSVWYDVEDKDTFGNPDDRLYSGTAWLMWCPIGDDPLVNDNWSHAEDIDGDCKNVLDTIEAVYCISFHESMWWDIQARANCKGQPNSIKLPSDE